MAGRTIVGGLRPTASGGDLIVWDDGTEYVVGTTSVADDHIAPVMLVPPDKPPIVAWGNHYTDPYVRVRVGTVNADLSSLGSEQQLAFGSVGATYHHLYRIGTDSALLFSRGDGLRRWLFRRTDNWGSSWASAVEFWLMPSGAHCYVRTSQAGDVIHCFPHDHHTTGTSDHNIYYFAIHTDTGVITAADGTVIADLDGTNLPLEPADVDLVLNPGSGRVAWGAGTPGRSSRPEMIVETYTEADDSDREQRYVFWDGSSWQNKPLAGTGAAPGGNACFTSSPAEFYASINGSIWHYTTEDDGDTWNATLVASSPTVDLWRPFVPYGYSTGLPVIWHRVSTFENLDAWVASLAGPD